MKMLFFYVLLGFDFLILAAALYFDFAVKGSAKAKYIYSDIKRTLVIATGAPVLFILLDSSFFDLLAFILLSAPVAAAACVIAIVIRMQLRKDLKGTE